MEEEKGEEEKEKHKCISLEVCKTVYIAHFLGWGEEVEEGHPFSCQVLKA